jgi:hypothetical protein
MKYTIELEYGGDPITGWTATVHFPRGGTVAFGSVMANALPYEVLKVAGDHIRYDMERSEENPDG